MGLEQPVQSGFVYAKFDGNTVESMDCTECVLFTTAGMRLERVAKQYGQTKNVSPHRRVFSLGCALNCC